MLKNICVCNNKEVVKMLIGEKFPSLDVNTTHGRIKLPDYFDGKWFILFSHPADFTPVCTTEFVAFQNKYEEFKKLNCGLIGLSVDQVFSHIKWIEWIKENLNIVIKFPIIADTGEVAKKLNLIHPKQGSNTVRGVFIVDDKSVIRAMLYYPQELGRNIDEILRMIKGFKTIEKEKVALPANWPKNELIGDKRIVPPPSNIKDAEKRKETYECYDWWFCYKKGD
nr:peroxiredoxin [Methanothermus fervidus]